MSDLLQRDTQEVTEEVISKMVDHVGSITEDEAVILAKWVNDTLINVNLLNMVSKGLISIDVKEGQPMFGATDLGISTAHGQTGRLH